MVKIDKESIAIGEIYYFIQPSLGGTLSVGSIPDGMFRDISIGQYVCDHISETCFSFMNTDAQGMIDINRNDMAYFNTISFDQFVLHHITSLINRMSNEWASGLYKSEHYSQLLKLLIMFERKFKKVIVICPDFNGDYQASRRDINSTMDLLKQLKCYNRYWKFVIFNLSDKEHIYSIRNRGFLEQLKCLVDNDAIISCRNIRQIDRSL